MSADINRFRKKTTKEQRNINPFHSIDPGFINRRKCLSVFGLQFRDLFDKFKKDGSDHWSELFNDHLMITFCLNFCKKNGVKSLGETLREIQGGKLFCSTEEILGNEAVWNDPRCKNVISLPYEYDKSIFLEYSTEHVYAATCKSQLSKGATLSIIGQIMEVTGNEIVIHPLVMGSPTFDHVFNKDINVKLTWFGWDFFETFPEDIDEFQKIDGVNDVPPDEWLSYMKKISEDRIKHKFCDILNEIPQKDWGGEQEDHFSPFLHLSGQRVKAAFLLKGPSRFKEMAPSHLGKKGDQIYRLASTPADILIIQHCHNIGNAVRAQLRAFAVCPHNPRRYCLIDGRDTYRILKAYNKL